MIYQFVYRSSRYIVHWRIRNWVEFDTGQYVLRSVKHVDSGVDNSAELFYKLAPICSMWHKVGGYAGLTIQEFMSKSVQ